MQVQDGFSVNRRPLDVEDYIDIGRRHRGWIFGPLFAAVVMAVVGAYLWPDTFISTATIKVTPQQVPEAYVQSNVNELMSDRISAIAQTVLSRPVLTSLITTHDLYPRDRQRLPMEDVVEKMRTAVKIGNVVNLTSGLNRDHVAAFQISFAYTDRYKAQRVVSDLVGKFIDQNLRERASSSLSTTQLLKDQWDQAKRELDQLEDKLAKFRMANQGRLPDEVQSNLQQLNAMQLRISNTNSALSRVSQEKLLLETQLRIAKDNLAALAKEPPPGEAAAIAAKNERLSEADREVRYYENQLAQLREHYKDTYPDVQRSLAMLNAAKKKRDDVAKDDQAGKKPEVQRTAPNPAREREKREMEASVRRLESMIEAKDLEAEQYRKDLSQATDAMKAYQSRMQGTPLSERTYTELVRDRDLAKARFVDLDLKMNKALLAQDMENRKAGENLEPLDPPSLPETPTEPKRPVIIGVGSGIGLLLGMVIAGVREVKDSSLKNLKDVRAYTQLPILGSVPLLENDLVVSRRRRLGWFGWSLACLTGVAVMSGSIIYYYVTKV
jgi:polysaccharide chain length determinant protein (PEP-CTERM system associated)